VCGIYDKVYDIARQKLSVLQCLTLSDKSGQKVKEVTARFLCSYLKAHSEELFVTTPTFSSYHETNISICICNYVTTKMSEDEKKTLYVIHWLLN